MFKERDGIPRAQCKRNVPRTVQCIAVFFLRGWWVMGWSYHLFPTPFAPSSLFLLLDCIQALGGSIALSEAAHSEFSPLYPVLGHRQVTWPVHTLPSGGCWDRGAASISCPLRRTPWPGLLSWLGLARTSELWLRACVGWWGSWHHKSKSTPYSTLRCPRFTLPLSHNAPSLLHYWILCQGNTGQGSLTSHVSFGIKGNIQMIWAGK